MSVLIDVADLIARKSAGESIALLDVRWKLGDPYGQQWFHQAHIPGAVYVDLETELAGPASPEEGRHPLPKVADLQEVARGWGIRHGQLVVVYDDVGSTSAARAWWLLRWAGLTAVRILDGGLGAWTSAGHDVETGPAAVEAGDVTLNAGAMPTIDADTAARLANDGVLLDARAAERYRGEAEPVDPRAGHVPGAVSAPTASNVDEDGKFRPPEQLRRRFAELGVAADTQIGVYCGSGVTAAHEIAALAVAGYEAAALYPGSWSQWSSDPSRPVATGSGTGGDVH